MIDLIYTESQFVSTLSERRAYHSPRLSLLGDVCNLTETGSMNGMEDSWENGICMLFGLGTQNTIYNMC